MTTAQTFHQIWVTFRVICLYCRSGARYDHVIDP